MATTKSTVTSTKTAAPKSSAPKATAPKTAAPPAKSAATKSAAAKPAKPSKPAKPGKPTKPAKPVKWQQGERLYEGKAKILYATHDPDRLIQFFKDDATAFNAKKRGTIVNKGILNNAISSHIFTMLDKKGIPTHFVKHLSPREMLVRRVQIVPVEVVVRNVAAGSLAARIGVEEGTPLARPVVEYFYKSDALNDPMINEDVALAMKWATEAQMKTIRKLALKVNDALVPFFKKRGIRLIDYKLEFGLAKGGKLILADEITPDGARLWDAATNEKLDKDRFRRDLGKIEEAYLDVARRVLGKSLDKNIASTTLENAVANWGAA